MPPIQNHRLYLTFFYIYFWFNHHLCLQIIYICIFIWYLELFDFSGGSETIPSRNGTERNLWPRCPRAPSWGRYTYADKRRSSDLTCHFSLNNLSPNHVLLPLIYYLVPWYCLLFILCFVCHIQQKRSLMISWNVWLKPPAEWYSITRIFFRHNLTI